MNTSNFECTCDSEGVNNRTGKCINCGKLYLKDSSEKYKQLIRLKHNLCPICCSKPNVEQPEQGLHGYTTVFQCGCEVDRPITESDYFDISQRCDEPRKPSWKDFVVPFRTRTKTLDSKFIVESVPDENVLSKIREELAEEVIKSQESYFFKGFDTKALLRIKEVLDNELKSRKDS